MLFFYTLYLKKSTNPFLFSFALILKVPKRTLHPSCRHLDAALSQEADRTGLRFTDSFTPVSPPTLPGGAARTRTGQTLRTVRNRVRSVGTGESGFNPLSELAANLLRNNGAGSVNELLPGGTEPAEPNRRNRTGSCGWIMFTT